MNKKIIYLIPLLFILGCGKINREIYTGKHSVKIYDVSKNRKYLIFSGAGLLQFRTNENFNLQIWENGKITKEFIFPFKKDSLQLINYDCEKKD